MIEAPSIHASAAMFVTVTMFVAFARGWLSTEIVSLLTIAVIAVGLYFFPLPHTQATDGLALAFSGFGHYALITICSLMIMGRGLVVTGALDPAARLLERAFKLNQQFGLLVSLVLAFFLSMFVNDTPVVILLLPIFVSLAARGGMAASKTLIPINAAVLLGGMGTTIGTSTNLLVVSIASDLGMAPIGVFQFTPIVMTAALVALPYLWLIAPRLLGDNRNSDVQARRRFVTEVRLAEDSVLTGKNLAAIMQRLPAEIEFHDPPGVPPDPRQRLTISGTHDALEEAMRTLKSEVAPAWVVDRIRQKSEETHEDIAVVETIVTADSRLIGRTLATSGIAEQYGVAILGVHRPGSATDPQVPQFTSQRIAEGDVLLVMGVPSDLQAFAQGDSLLVLEGMRELPRRSKAVLALGIMVIAVGVASLGLVPIAISALAGAIAMFVTGCVKFDRVGRALSAKVIVLVAASIAIGRLIGDTGAATWLGEGLSLGLQYLSPAATLAAIMLFVTLLTNFASNATAATIGTPIAINIAQQLGLPPEPLVLAVLFGCNLCYATPIAYQTNMLIMAEGSYQFRDYIRTGVPLVLLMVATLSVLLVMHYSL